MKIIYLLTSYKCSGPEYASGRHLLISRYYRQCCFYYTVATTHNIVADGARPESIDSHYHSPAATAASAAVQLHQSGTD